MDIYEIYTNKGQLKSTVIEFLRIIRTNIF